MVQNKKLWLHFLGEEVRYYVIWGYVETGNTNG